MPTATISPAMVAIGIVYAPIYARLVRGQVLKLREEEFVLAARAIGVPRRTILSSHILADLERVCDFLIILAGVSVYLFGIQTRLRRYQF